MSIVIPMDMPKTCRECIEMKIPVQCRVIKQEPVTAVMAGYNRPKDCPLVELPPHGELKDADAIVNTTKEIYCKGCNNYGGVMCRACLLDDCLSCIDNAPTILKASKED